MDYLVQTLRPCTVLGGIAEPRGLCSTIPKRDTALEADIAAIKSHTTKGAGARSRLQKVDDALIEDIDH